MATRKPPMSAKLARTIHTTDGATLRTRGEAADYMTALPEQRARYNAWQHAAKLMLDGADAEALTTQIEYALDGNRVGRAKLVQLAVWITGISGSSEARDPRH